MTPMKAIRAKCLDCCYGQVKEVRLCSVEKCPLHPYRFGKRPRKYFDTTQGSNEQKNVGSLCFFGKAARKENDNDPISENP